MQRWKLKAEGNAIDRVRQFPDALVAASYLVFASLRSPGRSPRRGRKAPSHRMFYPALLSSVPSLALQ